MLIVALAGLVAGCGGDGGGSSNKPQAERSGFASTIARAQRIDVSDFPAPGKKTLQQIAAELPAIESGLATSVFTPGRNRLAFGMIDKAKAFVYGPTVVYLARNPSKGPVTGPVAAPPDPLIVKPAFRSQGAAQATGDIAAVYEAQIDVPRAGDWYVLAATRTKGRLYGAASKISVTKSDPTPEPGERAPAVRTDTLANSGGDIKAIDTRVPPDDMHDVDLRDVIGKKPVALLFATPQLCQTRVCGPVVDIAAQMKAKYGDRIQFIHQEVYVGNTIDRGLRPPLEAYKLRTEPWLFTIDRRGKVAARLQGSFGTRAFERSIKAALR